MMAVIAGMKFDTKIETLTSIIKTVDYLILGGHIYNTYLAAKYDLEIKGVKPEQKEQAKEFIKTIGENQKKILIIKTLIESDKLAGKEQSNWQQIKLEEIEKGQKIGLHLGRCTLFCRTRRYQKSFGYLQDDFCERRDGVQPPLSGREQSSLHSHRQKQESS